METSNVMTEIRKIRDENSEKHLKMNDEERRNEAKKALDWLEFALGKPLKIVNKTN